MPVTYVIFNTVHFDGMGDFSHFKDLMHALLVNPLYRDVQFISVVCSEHFDEKRNANILKAMPAFNRGGFYFGSLDEHRGKIKTDKALLSMLATADQAICISYDDGLLDLYLPHMKKNLPIKAIGAHEAPLYELRAKHNKMLYGAYPLGLDKNRGIKIAPPPSSDRATLWQKIKKNNTALMQALPDDIEQNHFIVPAYYNNQYHFFTLLSLLALNHQHQNIVIFLSGITSNKITDKATMEALFTHSFVSKLNIITVDDEQSIKHLGMAFDSLASPEHERTITIISGAYLNDTAYDALYALAPMAGVSGDNTLEKCVSMDTLPLYWSTNEYSKVPTLRALRNITQSASLNITDVARQSFNTFFDAALYRQYHEKMLDCLYHEGPQPFGHPYIQVDILAMIEAWPTVTAHLRAHHNFYTVFDDIVLEHLPPESISEHARSHIRDQHALYGALETLGEKIISIYEEMLTHLTEADLDDPATQTMQTFLKTLIKSIKQIIIDPVHLAERCNTFNAAVDKLLHHDMRFVALQSHDDYSEVFTCIQNLMTDFATFAVRETETPHCFSFFQSKINLKPSIEALEEAVMTLPGHEKPSFK